MNLSNPSCSLGVVTSNEYSTLFELGRVELGWVGAEVGELGR